MKNRTGKQHNDQSSSTSHLWQRVGAVSMIETRSLNPHVSFVNDESTLDRVRDLRKRTLGNVYPDMDLDNDPLDSQALILYTENGLGEVNSTARLSFDGDLPLPEEDFLSEYRSKNWRLCEWGRFAIEDGGRSLLKTYYHSIYLIASRMQCDAIVMAMKPKDIELHQRIIGLRIAEQNMQITYGGMHSLACVLWVLKDTKPRFYKWLGVEMA